MLQTQELVELLKSDVVPALGCTEPVCVAFCTAKAASVFEGEIQRIDLEVSPGIYKNGMSAGIPGCTRVGLDFAGALGANLANPERGLEVFSGITEEVKEQAEALLAAQAVQVSIDYDIAGVYAKCTLTGEKSAVVCVVKDAHTNVVYLQKGEDVLLDRRSESAGTSAGNAVVERLQAMTIAEIRHVVDAIPAEDLQFLWDGVVMNQELAAYTETHEGGIGLADSLRKETGALLADGLMTAMVTKVVSAIESRLYGTLLPAMSSSGSGAKGLVVVIPVYETALATDASKGSTLRAIALAHAVNRYINSYLGKLSPMCTCVMASSTAASVGIAYLLGATDQQLGFAVKNMMGTVTGMICDGGKIGCALKAATGTSAALLSAVTAVHDAPLRSSDGILADTPEQCIKNVARVSSEGMALTDGSVLAIMSER